MAQDLGRLITDLSLVPGWLWLPTNTRPSSEHLLQHNLQITGQKTEERYEGGFIILNLQRA